MTNIAPVTTVMAEQEDMMKNAENESFFEEMIVIFTVIFFLMAGYGVYVGKYIAAVLAAVSGLFMIYANRMFKRQDKEQG